MNSDEEKCDISYKNDSSLFLHFSPLTPVSLATIARAGGREENDEENPEKTIRTVENYQFDFHVNASAHRGRSLLCGDFSHRI